MPARRTVKVAVVGSGLAGLTAAYRLARTPFLDDVVFEVHLFEKASSLGMDSHSVSLDLQGPNEEVVERRVDVPMRSFQGGYYPQLIAFYKHLGVKFRQRDFSYSFSTLTGLPPNNRDREITTTMIYNGASGREGVSMPSSMLPKMRYRQTKPLWFTPSAYALAAAMQLHAYGLFVLSTIVLVVFYLRLIVLSLPITLPERIWIPFTPYSVSSPVHFLTRPADKYMTLLEWTELTTPRGALARWSGLDVKWQEFVANVLVPLFSAVCTAGEDMIWEHPVEELLDYIWLTFGTHHYIVENGVRDVVERITKPVQLRNIHLSMPIVGLVYNADGASASGEPTVDIHCANNVIFHGFSHVILATQANHGASLLDTYIDTLPMTTVKTQAADVLEHHRVLVEAQAQTLRQFSYCRTIVVNHTDPALLPHAPRDRRDLNLVMASPLFALADPDDAPVASSSSPSPESHICLPPTYAMATHVLPHCPGVYQTTNPIVPPADGTVLSVAHLERAVVSAGGKAALGGLWRARGSPAPRAWAWGCAGRDGGVLGPLQGAGRLQREFGNAKIPGVWVCGSYAHYGIPLLEGCVVSARNVVEQGVWASEGIDASETPCLW